MALAVQGSTGQEPQKGLSGLRRALIVLAAILALETPLSLEAKATEIVATTEAGYARIILRLPRDVGFQTSINNGVLIINFDANIEVDAKVILRPLADYVSVVRMDPDGRTMRVALKRTWRIHTSRNDNELAIDLVQFDFAGDPPDIAPSAEELAAAEAAAREAQIAIDPATLPPLLVPVRIGEHSDYSRIVFDWPEPVDYTLELNEGELVVTFARSANLAAERLVNTPPSFVRKAEFHNNAGYLVVTLSVDPASPIHHFRNGPKVAFDIRAPRTDSGAPGAIVPMSAPAAQAAGIVAPPTPVTPPPPGTDAAANEDAIANENAPAPSRIVPADEVATHGLNPAIAAGEAGAHVASAHAPTDAAAMEAAIANNALEFRADVIGTSLRLEFPFAVPTPAALFRRGRTFYAVFNGDAPFAVETLPERFRDYVTEASRARVGDDTVVRMRLNGEPLATVSIEGMTWVLTLGTSIMETPLPIRLLREARTVGPSRVRATLEGASRVVAVPDEKAGDVLTVVTAMGRAQGMIAERSFVEFTALESSQGLAIRALAEDLEVDIDGNEVLIASPGGLSLSAGTVTQYAPERKAFGDALRPAFLDFASWRVTPAVYAGEHARLMNALGEEGIGLSAARLRLAQFYIAHDLAPEALGILSMLISDDQRASLDPTFLATRAVANFQARNYIAAKDDLATRALDSDPNAQLLRGIVAVALEDWPNARSDFAMGEEWVGRYPMDWQARFRLAAARVGLAVNDLGLAERQLGAMPTVDIPEPQALEAKLLKGQLFDHLDRTGEAMVLYIEVSEGGYRPLAARADFSIIVLKSRTGQIDAKDAIAELERLSWRWRGDRLELEVLKKLADLQITDGDYRNGLLTMRAAVLGFPEDPLARHVREDMERAFEDLFLNGRADALSPIQAVGLYYDFKELTPLGRLGDDMIRRLTDRLVGVDLLSQAAELLQYQVDNRLDGVAKASVATRLALVYLMDHEPEKALTAIRGTRQTRLPDELLAQRRLLEARALAELKQYKSALETLEQDDTVDAKRLKAEVSWMSADWQVAGERFEALASQIGIGALDDRARFDVLRAAISFTLANDGHGLSRLRETYGDRMRETSYGASFDMVTREVNADAVAFRDLARTIAGVDTLEKFLDSFAARYSPDETALLDPA